jgi:hypothetical protein
MPLQSRLCTEYTFWLTFFLTNCFSLSNSTPLGLSTRLCPLIWTDFPSIFEEWIVHISVVAYPLLSRLTPFSNMSFFKSRESFHNAKSPIEPTDSGYETNSPIPAKGKKKRTAFGKQFRMTASGCTEPNCQISRLHPGLEY